MFCIVDAHVYWVCSVAVLASFSVPCRIVSSARWMYFCVMFISACPIRFCITVRFTSAETRLVAKECLSR